MGRPLSALAGLTGLLLMPLALLVFSYAMQPALLVRYAAPTVLALAPAAAVVLARMSRVWILALCAFFVVVAARDIRHAAGEWRQRDAKMAQLAEIVRLHTDDHPIIFEQHAPHEFCHYAPDIAHRCYYLDGDRFGTDHSRRYAQLYGTPRVLRWEALGSFPRRYLVVGVSPFSDLPHIPDGNYPGFVLRRVAGPLYELIDTGGI